VLEHLPGKHEAKVQYCHTPKKEDLRAGVALVTRVHHEEFPMKLLNVLRALPEKNTVFQKIKGAYNRQRVASPR
jgi:hypothetical protein